MLEEALKHLKLWMYRDVYPLRISNDYVTAAKSEQTNCHPPTTLSTIKPSLWLLLLTSTLSGYEIWEYWEKEFSKTFENLFSMTVKLKVKLIPEVDVNDILNFRCPCDSVRVNNKFLTFKKTNYEFLKNNYVFTC